MPVVDSRAELRLRQDALRAEADELIPGLVAVLGDVGPVMVTGSYVSGLMSWREIDLMVLGGPDFAPRDVLELMRRVITVPGVVELDYRDERGVRRPTEHVRDERYHVGVGVEHGSELWRFDLSIWLHDVHANVTEWHERLRESITPEERDAVLWIKDVWHRRPEYPQRVSGLDVYEAVLQGGVRTPEEFAGRLAERGHPGWD
jgi:hypothetical protein